MRSGGWSGCHPRASQLRPTGSRLNPAAPLIVGQAAAQRSHDQRHRPGCRRAKHQESQNCIRMNHHDIHQNENKRWSGSGWWISRSPTASERASDGSATRQPNVQRTGGVSIIKFWTGFFNPSLPSHPAPVDERFSKKPPAGPVRANQRTLAAGLGLISRF